MDYRNRWTDIFGNNHQNCRNLDSQKITNLTYPTHDLALPMRVTVSEFHQNLWHEKNST